MTDIPIIFSAPMVRALLREVDEPGTGKTRTRRLAWQTRTLWERGIPLGTQRKPSPWQNVIPGDRLYVRESHWRYGRWIGRKSGGKVAHRFAASSKGPDSIVYAEDGNLIHPTRRGKFAGADDDWHMRPSIFMPRELSRLTLSVTSTRIERLHDIDEDDCASEGLRWKNGLWRCPAPEGGDWHATETAIDCWRWLWTKLHGEESWLENPEVVVLGFSVRKVNVDAVKEAA